jgi:type IV pilus assembly protein PilO
MALGEKEKKQLLILAIILAVAGGGAYYMLWWQPGSDELTAMHASIDSMQVKVDSAKADLARGTVESLRQRVDAYQGQLGLLRRLVPSGNDVPNLIDDVSNRAKRRGVGIAKFTPGTADPNPPFQVFKYAYSVFGHYDEISGFLSDVASLPRIMVPYDIKIDAAKQAAMRAYGDTTGALLEMSFSIKTFVKPQAADSAAGAAR